MTPAELRPLVFAADIYKMSLGKTARYRAEALEHGVLVFGSEKFFHEAVLSGDESEIARTGRLIKQKITLRQVRPRVPIQSGELLF